MMLLALAAVSPLFCPAAGPLPEKKPLRAGAVVTATGKLSADRPNATCSSSGLSLPGSGLRALIGRNFSGKYYVGLSAGKSWRPLEHFGDRDSKLRVHSPTVGVAVRYSF